MNFTSLMFLPFVAVVCLMYFTVFRRCQWFLLLLASIAFYLFSGPKYIVFIIITALSTYLLALLIQELHEKEKEALAVPELKKEDKKKIKKKYTRRKKFWLILDFLINIGLLCVIKYLDFALTGVTALLKHWNIDWSRSFNFVLPLGISFYTFMAVGYILDIYWKRYKAEENPLRFMLFTMYFPHILQGPIARYNKLAPQFCEKHRFNYDQFTKGIQLMLWGYFEKMVIADRLAIFANGVYAKWDSLTGVPLVIAIVFSPCGCIWISRDVWTLRGAYLRCLALNWNSTSGTRIFQRICRNSGEDGTSHWAHGLRIISFTRFPCQNCVNPSTSLREENGAIRFPVLWQQ